MQNQLHRPRRKIYEKGDWAEILVSISAVAGTIYIWMLS